MRFAWASRLFSLFSRRFAISLLIVIAQIVFFQPVQPVAATIEPAVQMAPGDPQLILTKSIENGVTTAQVGDVIRYRIRFECSSLTTTCGEMEITDVLQDGLIYLPPPASSVPAGFSINYAAGTRTITITKDDNNLLDGSQYDAVIAVRVDYDLRPLPATVNNQVNGRIDPPGPISWTNATPSNAPPITIGPVGSYWAMTKTLSSPLIEPTVDTDVTYQLQLCPTTPLPGEGNAALHDIVMTDTLPVGATFVSASNGGVESSGVVTWPLVAGPVYPPNCVIRYVTVRYETSNGFAVDDEIINNADFTADYTPSTGTCTSPCTSSSTFIDHDIDPIFEVPNYSKVDDGDPIGITGTGRFLLDLDTLDTNYPSNELILVDNIPAELQVTSVTSGRWSLSFDYVQVYVEYSTNHGSTYTAFGPPVSFYDALDPIVTYTAPVTNITNVRWRFEYDPDATLPFTYTQAGLPYTWSFSASPEIRVIPRTVDTVADPPSGASLPAAVAGTTYTNCLQVHRTDSTDTQVADPCVNENLTVQGTYVSLITSKAETAGAAWDDLDDPQINTFTSDSSLLPGDTLRYRITVEVTERSSAPLINPTIQDTLPAATDFVFVRNGSARLDGVVLPAAQQPTFTQSGQVLTWTWNNPSPALTVNPLALGSRFLTVEFFARIPRGQTPGTYTNNLYTTTDSVDVYCEEDTEVADGGDIDTDGDSGEPGCETTDDYVIERSAALRGEKWIRSTDVDNIEVLNSTNFLPDATCPNGGTTGLPGGGTNPFTRYPCISQAYPEGALGPGQFVPPPLNPALDDFEYNVRIFNDGNVPMLSYVLYDILPYVGDTGSGGTLASSPRLSEFRPALTGPIGFISGPAGLSASDFTIEYNATTNPCRPEVFNQSSGTVPSGCDNTWSLDWSGALSYRIRLNDGSFINPSSTSAEVRFGVPMHIPLDADPADFDPNDARSHEIAWNSFSHVGSYDKDPDPVDVEIQDLLASEPRKVGITVPERMSVGNRVWRDADNSGTINAPDDAAPGIENVTVNLYRDADDNGIPDGAAIATTLTDVGGYYLFSNIPYDAYDDNNNRYIIGIPASNFLVGQPLENLRSSTGTPPSTVYTNPSLNTTDSRDDGIDPATLGWEVLSPAFILEPDTEPQNESDLSDNDRDGLPDVRRGLNGERDDASDLTIDFGFFGGTDIPFSLGNHVWIDDGAGGGVINDGIRQASELPVSNVLVRLYRDGDADGVAEPAEMIRTDVTDINGFYLFDNLDPGPYFVEIEASNFALGGPLAGLYSSQPTGTETVGVNGGMTVADIDNDDNGINDNFPEVNGIFSGVVVLIRLTPEPSGETYLSGEADPGAPNNQGYSPTGWDGPGSIGRFGETDTTSNLTIDFGFIPPMSLGNRVWIDEGLSTLSFPNGYDNGEQDSGELGVSAVRVELWRDTNGTSGLQVGGGTPDTRMDFTTTDADGYYLFERLQPATDYFVHIPASNFDTGGALENYLSSMDANQVTAPADDSEDEDDNGIDSATPATTGITSSQITMTYGGEPLTPTNETDINTSGAYGPNNVGNLGQQDGNSNLTMDFGFVRPPRSLGNRLWMDTNNNGQVDGGEPAVPASVRVSLYLDDDADGEPDDLGTPGDRTDDWLAYDFTDANGYYLFDRLPPYHYIVGVDRVNFAAGGLLEGYNSSTGNVDNASNNTDNRDNGVDRLQRADPVASPHGILSTSIDFTARFLNAPTGETGSGDTSSAAGLNPTAGDGPASRGRYDETDSNSDLTIDFGFFLPMSLGNRVFLDDGTGGGTNNNGIMEGGELPIANVRVELYHDDDLNGVPDGALMAFDVTDAGGYYLFDGLPEGSYVVVIPAGNFTASFDPDGGGPLPTAAGALLGYNNSLPTGTEAGGVAGNPYTPNTDRDDNGVNDAAPATNGIRSGTITLSYSGEPSGEIELSGEADPGAPGNLANNPTGWDGSPSRGRGDESDANSNLTIDFGFVPLYGLGNRVWFDTNNNSLMDAGEVGVDGVTVELYLANASGNPIGAVIATDTTTAGGFYLFDDLYARDYVVVIPASNFADGAILNGYWSSATSLTTDGTLTETSAPDADTDETDADDNGTHDVSGGAFDGAVIAAAVTLGPSGDTEPVGEVAAQLESGVLGNQGIHPDVRANMTVDFGFYRLQLSNLIFTDANQDGTYNAGDIPHVGATVQLFTADGTTEINVGPDGILGTTDDASGGVTSGAGGTYLFSGLPQGEYIVKATPLPGYSSTVDTANPTDLATPNTNIDDNDNGIGIAVGQASSNAIPLTPGSTGLANMNVVDNNTGTTSNPTMDFGFYYPVYSLGNRVWFDTDNSGTINGAEVGVDDVTVELYAADLSGNPTGAVLDIQVTASGGYYRFDTLLEDDYVVLIPASEFAAGGTLNGYWSSGTTISNAGAISETAAPDPDNNTDSDDNGTLTSGAVISGSVTLGPGTSEPTSDTDIPSPNPAGEAPNNQSNLTVDFGFYRLELSNQVFIDVNKNGTYDAGDGVLPDATVQLFTADGSTEINVGPDGILGTADDAAGGVTTGAGGTYLFSGLPQGSYIVRMTPPSSSYTSTIDTFNSVDSTDPNQNIDDNDNGVGLNSGQVSGNVITLTAGSSGATSANTVTDATGTTSNPTMDFGVMPLYSLGNRVWFDTNNNSVIDFATEAGVDGVDVQLYAADVNGEPAGAALATQTTANDGYYRFDALDSGDYVVVIPASELGTGGTLNGYWSSGTTLSGIAISETASPDPDNDSDSDDNGSLQTTGTFAGSVISKAITLGPGTTEPTSEADIASPNPAGEAPNNQSNLTVDFGFYRVELSNQIFVDIVQDGMYTGSDLVLPGATVQLFASNGITEINVGPDGILGTSDDAAGGILTGAGGTYLFSGLPQGTYIVSVTPPVGYSSAIDSGAPVDTSTPNTNTDNNDNGVGVAAGQVFSNTVTLTPGNAATNNIVVNETGTTTNPTVDFGFTAGFAKTLLSTDAAHTTDPEVTIGEIINYEISMLIPVGTINNVTVVDTPQSGLAFVDCIDITLPASVTSSTVTSGACDANDGTTSGSSIPLIENSGGRATFNLGTMTNSTASAQLVTIEYSLIVLDISDNQNGDTLTNSAVWTWAGGSKSTSALPVEIVEPELTIDKNATPTSASYGSIITFTIDVAHDLVNSTADAFDVIVTDQIPAGLTFIPGSETTSGTATLTSFNYNVGTNTLTFVWDVFRLNETASVSFQATFDGPAPVVNSASVEWTSLLIDPQLPGPPPVPVQLSPYHPSATERWYDPAAPAGVNNYAVTDSATLTEFRPRQLPHTGFAPGVATELPAMPEDFAYAKTDVWLEIPQLKLQLDIVGVPFSTGNKDWDLKWLGSNAGWLDGTAFPTYEGNSALTAHSTLSNGKPGPFANLSLLKYGDQIIIHLGGQKYIYEIRENKTVLPSAVNSVLKHEEYSWLTLITCKTYNETTKEYSQRTVVRAVLIKVVDE